MADVRDQIVKWARWGVDNHAGFTYTEGGNRMEGIGHPGVPCHCDCSAFVTLCYNWAGAPDPNGQGYDGQGYTGTLLSHGVVILKNQAVPGDVVVYGPGTGDHTAMIVEAGNDPLTVSMGEQGDPSYVRVSQDGRQPQRFLRFNTIGGGQPAPASTPQPSQQHIIVPGVSVQQVQAKVGVAQDGAWGPITQGAVLAFQHSHNLTADGIVGPQTWGAMNASPKPPSPTPTNRPTLAQGATGDAVKVLQQRLGALVVDGQFGPATNNRLRQWQGQHGLAADGVCGPLTWAALGG